ncbi:hypothetical protein [Raoultella terrigena]|jgi:hypothetical protein|nr:hypothetical protein [Raoultella terrigena]
MQFGVIVADENVNLCTISFNDSAFIAGRGSKKVTSADAWQNGAQAG